jgi:hypothetical protein
LRKLRLLAAMLAVVAAMVASSVSPATATHWDLYDDEWGVCGWNWTPIWPYWEYDCHHYFGPVWGPSWVGFDSRDVDRLDRHRWDVDRVDHDHLDDDHDHLHNLDDDDDDHLDNLDDDDDD